MARSNIPGIDSRLTRLVDPSSEAAGRTMQLTAETYQVLKEHASRYYSSPRYDEVLVNLVKFYEEKEGPKHYAHYNNVNIMTID